MQRKAFTLIELLVVIAIIAILAAILFPVFAQAKAAAKRTADLSNTKNITLGQILYTSDSDDIATPYLLGDWNDAGYARWNMLQWKDLLLPYIKNGGRYVKPSRDPYLLSEGKVGGIFESPTDEHAWEHNPDQPTGAGGDSTTRFPRSYALNADAGRNEFGVYGAGGEDFSKKTSIWPYVEYKDQGNIGGSGSMTSLENGANTIMITGTRLPYPTIQANNVVFRCDPGWCGYSTSTQNWVRSVGNGLLNIGFFDGHAKAVKGKQAIANDMFDLYSKYITQDGWPGKKQVLDYMKDLSEWQ